MLVSIDNNGIMCNNNLFSFDINYCSYCYNRKNRVCFIIKVKLTQCNTVENIE